MRYGVVILPEHDWSEAAARWVAAEQLGFDHGWTFDHLMWRWLRAEPWFATVPTLGAVAAVTRSLQIGTLVASPNFRHPVTFAKEIMTIDNISQGRAICGIGAGTEGFDTRGLGATRLTADERMARFEEFVELSDHLLTNTSTTARGAYYQIDDVFVVPGCVQRPRVPFAVAASGRRGMRLAARFGQFWVTVGQPGHYEERHYSAAIPLLREQMSRLEEACALEQRDSASMRRMVVAGPQIGGVLDSVGAFQDASGALTDIGFTDLVVFWPRADFPYAGNPDVLEQLAGVLGE